jgi:hypothetical protein
VVRAIVAAAAQPAYAKISDYFGRVSILLISCVFYVVGKSSSSTSSTDRIYLPDPLSSPSLLPLRLILLFHRNPELLLFPIFIPSSHVTDTNNRYDRNGYRNRGQRFRRRCSPLPIRIYRCTTYVPPSTSLYQYSWLMISPSRSPHCRSHITSKSSIFLIHPRLAFTYVCSPTSFCSPHPQGDGQMLICSNTWVAGFITERVLLESNWQWGIGMSSSFSLFPILVSPQPLLPHILGSCSFQTSSSH